MKYYLLAMALLVLGCTQQQELDSESYSMDDVLLHNSSIDCWMIIGNNAYDLTDYIAMHPGGNSMLQGCGKNATELFESRPMGSGTPHSNNARNLLNNYLIGELD